MLHYGTIHPFSFREFLRHHEHEVPDDPSVPTAKKTAALDHQFARYLGTGGFPEAQAFDPTQLLQGYIDVLLLRDVVERHKVANVTELQRRRTEIAYVKTVSGFEVDFLARYPDGSEELIQVCTSIDDPETRERELRALQDTSSEHPNVQQVILPMESRMPFPPVPKPINILPAWNWMLSHASGS